MGSRLGSSLTKHLRQKVALNKCLYSIAIFSIVASRFDSRVSCKPEASKLAASCSLVTFLYLCNPATSATGCQFLLPVPGIEGEAGPPFIS